jgi:hypothetical protein
VRKRVEALDLYLKSNRISQVTLGFDSRRYPVNLSVSGLSHLSNALQLGDETTQRRIDLLRVHHLALLVHIVGELIVAAIAKHLLVLYVDLLLIQDQILSRFASFSR